MQFVVIGLGNPGSEYENTRHNTGAMVLEVFRKAAELPDWTFDKKRNALVSTGKLSTFNLQLIRPQTFMNKSAESLKGIKDLKLKGVGKGKDKRMEMGNLVVIHDDLDIPFGSYKISFNKSSGGHRGVESIIKAVKTQAFARVRVGIASSQSAVRKSQDDAAVEKIILGKFNADQMATLKKMSKNIVEGLHCLITESREKAMSQYHL